MRIVMMTVLLLAALFGEEIHWVHSYDEATEKAAKEGKNVLVLITTESCRWCRKLEAYTLTDQAVVRRINEKYVAVHVTRDVDDYPETLKAPYVPTSYFLRPDGKIVHDMMGYWSVEDYLSILDDADYELKK